MTHFQEVFIENIRLLRKKKGISQLCFSEMLKISPNYLNAIENGKNFPSPEVVQRISDVLEVLPYRLFLETPVDIPGGIWEKDGLVQELTGLKQRLAGEIDKIMQKYGSFRVS